MAAVVPVSSPLISMGVCGVPLAPLFDGIDPQVRIAKQVFMNSFETCLNLTIDDVKDALVSFSKLTVANGRISLQPGTKRNIIAFVQWTRNELRNGRDSAQIPFPLAEVVSLQNDLKLCTNFVKQSELLAGQAKPRKLMADVDWIDWEPTFVNYLRLIPGITGIPLAYVIRRDPLPVGRGFVGPILDIYVANAPLLGPTYDQDASHVYTLLLTFINEYPEIETIVRTATQTDGRIGIQSLVTRFEGVGALANDLIQAKTIVQDLFYGGEKKKKPTCTGRNLSENSNRAMP